MDIDDEFESISLTDLVDNVDKLIKAVESNQLEIERIKESMVNTANSLVKVFDSIKIKMDILTANIDDSNNYITGIDNKTHELNVKIMKIEDKLRNK